MNCFARRRRFGGGIRATLAHAFVYDRYRDSHDLWHVLIGYGTDIAGEAGIIAWTYAPTGSRGYPLIFLLNALRGLERARPYPMFQMADAPGAPDEPRE